MQISIKTLLSVLVTSLISLLLLMGVYTVIQVSNIGVEMANIANKDMPLTKSMTHIVEHELEQEVLYEKLIKLSLEMVEDKKNTGLLEKYQQSSHAFAKLTDKIASEIFQIKEMLNTFLSTELTETERLEFKELLILVSTMAHLHDKWLAHAKEAIKASSQGQWHQLTIMEEDLELEAKNLTIQAESILEEIERFTLAAMVQTQEHEESLYQVIIIALIIAVFVGVLIARFILKRIHNGLNLIDEAIHNLAKGDLSISIPQSTLIEIDKIMNSLRSQRNSLKNMVEGLIEVSHEVASAAAMLESNAQGTKSQTQHQLRSIETVTKSMEELLVFSQHVLDNSQSSKTATSKASSASLENKDTTHNTSKAIHLLVDNIRQTSTQVTQLSEKSNNVALVLEVIKGIADQTNLLALNAAIEAARAGEQGRGFAVVADEVRNLAKRTQESTIEIESILAELRNGSKETVSAMNICLKNGALGHDLTKKVNTGIEYVHDYIEGIREANIKISNTAQQQFDISDGLANLLSDIHDSAKKTDEIVEHTTFATNVLEKISKDLFTMVAQFKIEENPEKHLNTDTIETNIFSEDDTLF
ncbi:MAG: methyl-accepting chemotaxis protein [Colwellia sp.]|nr:methyl-accepting chemotaxis protein [Colwellia sp.]